MITIRKNVFETNSSSVHTITISRKGLEESNLPIKRRKKEDGTFGKFVIAKLGSFDKNTCDYTTQEEKLSYLLTLCFLLDGRSDLEYMKECWEFEELNDMVKEYCHCDGIFIDKSTLDDAYIDHQTLCDYYSVSDFGMDYKDFVFNSYIGLHTTCD